MKEVAAMSQASKPRKKRWPGALGKPIEGMPKAFIDLRAQQTSSAMAEEEEKQRIEQERIVKLLLLADHYRIRVEASPGFLLALLRELAIDVVDGFKVVEFGTSTRPGAPSRWKSGEGALFLAEVEARPDGQSLEEALEEIRKLAPKRYGQHSLATLKTRYYEVLRSKNKN
jgi:hypothetical protein